MAKQQNSAYTLYGRITDLQGNPLAGLIVRAYDQDPKTPDNPLGKEAVTNAEGRYQITFTEQDFKIGGVESGGPDVFIRVFDGDELLGESPVKRNAKKRITIDLKVDYIQPVPDEPARSVSGVVRNANGDLLQDITVRAFDLDLRHEQALGECQTDKQGFYQIQYFSRQFRRREKGNADLVVKALKADGSLLAASPVLFNAPSKAEVDIVVPADALTPPTLFEKIAQTLQPLLEGLKVEDLEEDQQHQDLSFLSGETGFEKQILARFVLSHKLGVLAIQPEFWFALLGGSFFQYTENQSLDEQLIVISGSLSSLDAAAVRKALTRSFNLKEIPDSLREKMEDWIEGFLKFITRQSVAGKGEPTFVKSALEEAGIKDAGKQEKFARLFNERKALTPELLEALEKDESFKKEEIADLRTSFKLAELTRGDFSVVKMIKGGFRIRQPEDIRSLAKKGESEWAALIKEKHAAGDIKLPWEIGELPGNIKLSEPDVYAKTLERQFREAFPTAAFTGGLERALNKGGAKGLRHAEVLGRFLEAHKDFELLNTPVDDFLKNGIHPEFEPLAKDENFRLEVKAVQRVFKLAPNFEATDTLLADDLHSAQKVYRMGETEFVRRYAERPGFTADSARKAWNRAADTHAAVLTIIGDLKEFDEGILPGILKSSHPALSNFPNWNNLFQSGDLCECDHCRSVLGPAAYFADLLMFLKDRKALNISETVKDILFQRRPDLGYLELNCENALTPLPYVDVVCEVLEDVVDAAQENDLVLSGLNAIPPNDAAAANNAVTIAFNTAFADPVNNGKEKIELGDSFSISQIDPIDPDRWVVHGDNVAYLLKKKGPALHFFAEIVRNTKASAEELRAYPQYVNPKAYEKLKQVKYPQAIPLDLFPEGDSKRLEQRARSFALPFDLFAEEVRAGFQKSNLQRWDLMRTLRGTALPNNPADGDIAAEYFGISADPNAAFDEKRLILEADPSDGGQQERWGEPANAGWLDTIGNVNTFLRKTGLEYNELLALLDLKFINPTGDITIHHLDPSCDTDEKAIRVLDALKLDRIHRFLRLWRKLKGWKMWELDLVIGHPVIGGGVLNEAFLGQLFYFDQLLKRLGKKTTVEQLGALFGNLNIDSHFTGLHKKRDDGLYQSLFLNRKLIQPLDPAFQIDPATNDLPAGGTITNPVHQPVVLAVLGISESDLNIFKGLTFGGNPYINNNLNLGNLSFLWRHSWLSKLLKYKADEYEIVHRVCQQGISQFANPRALWEFLEKIDHLKATGFKPDEIKWILAADDSAKAAIKEADAARFLVTLRKELQAIKAENDPSQYDFLSAVPPTDADQLSALLGSLLKKLNRNEMEVQFFIATLRDEIVQQSIVPGIPEGFTFPVSITGAPNNITIQYTPVLTFSGRMTAGQRNILKTDASLAFITGTQAYLDAIDQLYNQPGQPAVVRLPAGFDFPAPITGAPNHIPICYEPVLRFTGWMTAAARATLLTDLSLATITGITAYQEAIESFYNKPRLALKFLEQKFIAPLANLPAAVNFMALPEALKAKISYDVEQQLLCFTGILTKEEKAVLDTLSADLPYRSAVNSLATQPGLIASPDERIWLVDTELQVPLRDLNAPVNDNLGANLATAITKALAYLLKTLSVNAVVQQCSAQLGLTEALTRRLLTQYAVIPQPLGQPPITLMAQLTEDFTNFYGVVDYANLKSTFDGWYWANRVAFILKNWKITLKELEKITFLTAGASLLDFLTLPLDQTGAVTPIDPFLNTSRFLRMRERLPEKNITLLEVLEKLSKGDYNGAPATFAAAVETLNDAWLAANAEQLITSLDLTYPGDYLLPENWERLRRAFYFLDNLNTGTDTAKTFAAVAMTYDHAKRIKELLCSKFGEETWLTLSAEIQDALRERKRDALVAYLLTHSQPQPEDIPSGKWENTNDLYAYYLLDVEMGSCQLTSRLVQGSGSVQLFVQRCFMGLEPKVAVNADKDSAWRWWKWMRKYRVWEANRKVFLWPENWIEPELKKDRSPFFRDMENELLQNEINQDNVEKAFLNYLEKLDGVAQLEIAGFYQEDDGDNTILHVFGRTPGAEPHLYYYRRYDYRQWSPWEKVNLDIQGDYLIPAVVNKRLFLFWPVFTEVPDESAFGQVPYPVQGSTTMNDLKAKKKLRLQMAVSDYRQGKWTPKKVSVDFDESRNPYEVDIVRKHYRFYPIDSSGISGCFGIKYEGYSIGSDGSAQASLYGAFEIAGCKGVPEKTTLSGNFMQVVRPEWDSAGDQTAFQKWIELDPRHHDDSEQDFTLQNLFSSLGDGWQYTPLLMQTPGLFKVTSPWHLSYLDKFALDGYLTLGKYGQEGPLPVGSWLPFFYNDDKRTFFVLPSLKMGNTRNFYPAIKGAFRGMEFFFEGQINHFIDSAPLPAPTSPTRPQAEQYLYQRFREMPPPPYSDEQIRDLLKRFLMRYIHLFLSSLSLGLFQFRQYYFKNYYHPFVCDFAKLVDNPLKGIPALMSRETQLKNSGFDFQQSYQPTLWTVEDIPLTFSILDIVDLPSFTLKLINLQDAVSTFIQSKLSATAIQDIVNYRRTGADAYSIQSSLIEDLNHIIANETVFQFNRFSGVRLRPKTLLLLILNPTGEELIRLNRLLLEDAYPNELSRGRDAYPREVVDFSPDGAYSPYNWELFFHTPLLIANSLSRNQRFEEARDWYHFIFNPLGVESAVPGGSPMSKYWITKPFFETTDQMYVQQRIDNILRMLAGDANVPGYSDDVKKALEGQVLDWRTYPFEPHRIANYRTVAYQKTVVMKYLDNLIEWGDYLFRQDSMESINEATQLYVLAAEILGPRPRKIPPQGKPPVESFNELEKEFDKLSNALVEVENLVPQMEGNGPEGADSAPLPMLYFCIPQNDKMLSYWDTVADRLYKVRHCMNIEGVVRQLSLFEPPIDPGALVKAVAGGVDISSALADLNAPLPLYRFNILLQKANEVCNDVKALGAALLAALEKKDAEAMGLLRQSQEIRVLEAVKTLREKQIEEAKENRDGLKKNKESAEIRKKYYESREFMNAGEIVAISLNTASTLLDIPVSVGYITAGVLKAIPNFLIGASGFGGSPHATAETGGHAFGDAAKFAAEGLGHIARNLDKMASLSSTLAGYQRRQDDWNLQKDLAVKEMEQLDKSIAAAELRIAIAEKELENHMLQMENAKAIDEFMRSKYTNEELYQWQVGQISGVYFQSYRLAYDLAKRAERGLRFELGLQDSSYINFGYWDSLKKGLLSGEKLQYDLRRLETAYLEQNRREFELTKHISLTLLDPLALVQLRETGRCFFSLPEEIFDLDFPGHYFRRIKSVSLTLPCVVGPYTTVSCTLRLTRNSIRINTANGDNGYPRNTDGQSLPSTDDRFIENNIPVKAIAVSNAQNDSGVFELNFRDERYLPFEGAGTISDWSLELFNDPKANNPDPGNPDFGRPLRQFDYSTISDAILHIKYTAREDAGSFKNSAVAHLRDYFSQDGATNSLRMFNLRQEFPSEWRRFLHPTNPVDGNVFSLEMSSNLFPIRDKDKPLKINTIWLLARCTDGGSYNVVMRPPLPAPPPVGSDTMTLDSINIEKYGGLHFSEKDVTAAGIVVEPTTPPVKWLLKMTRPGGGNLQEDQVKKVMEVEDVLLVLGYEWE